jgi:hypothetical protein
MIPLSHHHFNHLPASCSSQRRSLYELQRTACHDKDFV